MTAGGGGGGFTAGGWGDHSRSATRGKLPLYDRTRSWSTTRLGWFGRRTQTRQSAYQSISAWQRSRRDSQCAWMRMYGGQRARIGQGSSRRTQIGGRVELTRLLLTYSDGTAIGLLKWSVGPRLG